MKKFILLTLILIKFITVNAQWQTIYKDSVQYQFYCVHFLNNDTGFVGGWEVNNWNYAGVIFRTNDGGQTWDTTNLGFIILDIHFINDTIGFAGGDYGVVYATYDGGDTWIYKGGAWFSSDVSSIYFKDSLNGFKLNMCLGLYKTTDGGINWQLYPGLIINSYWPGNSRFRFPSPTRGYLIAGGGDGSNCVSSGIAKTTDGTNTWSLLSIPSNFYPYSAHFFDTISGIVIGRNGKISTTNDGGQTWSTPYSISQYPLYDIEFVTDSIGYIIGGSNPNYGSTPYKGIIYKTIDKGASWIVLDSSIYNGLNKLHFPSSSIGYAVGMNGNILKITNADNPFTSVQQIFDPDNSFSVYPNPATNYINFKINQPQPIIIFDVFGRIIMAKLVTNEKINISDLSPGIYFIRTENRIAKFVKI